MNNELQVIWNTKIGKCLIALIVAPILYLCSLVGIETPEVGNAAWTIQRSYWTDRTEAYNEIQTHTTALFEKIEAGEIDDETVQQSIVTAHLVMGLADGADRLYWHMIEAMEDTLSPAQFNAVWERVYELNRREHGD